ncbi:MAG: hypothetical protein KKG53_08280 [Proteobacteria bacterium]|nr:hypothetical protein [Pseudomonadota bacterium]
MKETTKTQTQATTTRNAQEDINQASKAGILMVTTMAGLIGAWGLACMVGALMTNGIGGVVTGYLSAITGM